ncbi:MAG TPA: type II toxin-antitoxin system RelE/ParE family toxin [Devosia sp.]
MRRLSYSDASLRDIGDLAEYAADVADDDRVGRATAAKLDEQCRKLANLPGLIGRPRDEVRKGLRSFPFGNYVIYFRYQDDETFKVVNVLSAKQDVDDFPFDPDDLVR